MQRRIKLVFFAATLAVPRFAVAQTNPSHAGPAGTVGVPVHGIAYDSLRREPLGDAFIAIAGLGKSTTTDARGRFAFENVPPGTYTFNMQHAALDSLGLSGVATRSTITDGGDEIRMTVPSFATFWHKACAAGDPPTDSAFVYGVVRDAGRQNPVANATVEVTWVDVTADKIAGIHQRRYRSQTHTDASGTYGVCGVPAAIGIRVQASNDSAVSGLIDLPPRDVRVRRRDLVIGASAETDSTKRGTIVGEVTDGAGHAFPNARLVMDEVPEVRSGADGHFVIRNVPAGTRQVEVLSVGMAPAVMTVDVAAHDTVPLTIPLRRVTTLDAMRVTASARQRQFYRAFDERRRLGFGYTMDSTEFQKRGTLAAVFGGFPSTQVQADPHGRVKAVVVGTPPCPAILWIDGVRQFDQFALSEVHPDELAVVEVYPHGLSVPAEFMTAKSKCGAVAIWTKRGLK
ncbi:MAG TPA: carboxypeptidase regulatory-like domain-containing protein [Gemmatimonadaceae bacterium]|nr:carboxypeptidase regulatory-like domain-containing protein [Gemmatimonadaceae bacterium]